MNGRIVSSPRDVGEVLAATRTIAVLGIKPESHASQPGFFVPAYMLDQGYEIIPVPTYYPDVTQILSRPVFRKLADIKVPVDMVNVFRRPSDIPPHLEDILALNPKSVWFQSGITHNVAARTLADAGIVVVQDQCLMVEHGRWARSR